MMPKTAGVPGVLAGALSRNLILNLSLPGLCGLGYTQELPTWAPGAP